MKKRLFAVLLSIGLTLTLLPASVMAEDQDAALVTVAFDSAGGTEVSPQTFESGGYATKPEAPTREGWDFYEWFTGRPYEVEGDNIFYFDRTPVTENLTLHAAWYKTHKIAPIDYTNNTTGGGTITIDGGEPVTGEVYFIVFDGDTHTLVATPNEGFTFIGWSRAGDREDIISTEPTFRYENKNAIDIYALFRKTIINQVELTVKPPVCGTEITLEDKDDSWSQTNPPSVSIPDGTGYTLYTAYDGASPAIWVDPDQDGKPFEGKIVGGKAHTLEVWLVPDSGVFSEDVEITVNGGALVEKISTPGALGIIASVTAVHDPAEPVKENRVEPTYAAEGSYDEVIYCNGCGAELSRKTIKIPATGGDTAKKGTGVKTGDNANAVLYMGLGIAALLIIAVTLILLKRRSRNEQ